MLCVVCCVLVGDVVFLVVRCSRFVVNCVGLRVLYYVVCVVFNWLCSSLVLLFVAVLFADRCELSVVCWLMFFSCCLLIVFD